MRFMPFFTLLAMVSAVFLNACAPSVRTAPPAPIVEGRRAPPPAPVPAPVMTPAPAPEPTRVYAYQPPTTLPTDSSMTSVPITQPGADQTATPGFQAPAPPAAAQPTQPMPQPNPASTPGSAPALPAHVPAPAQQTLPPAPLAEQPAPPAVAPPAPETQVALADTLAPNNLSPALDALVRQAEAQRQSSDYAGAAATLERALRLQERDAYLWNRLAHVRLEQGLATQAASLAARANALSGDQAGLRRDNWLVIANAKRRAGDLAGAQEAERKAAGG